MGAGPCTNAQRHCGSPAYSPSGGGQTPPDQAVIFGQVTRRAGPCALVRVREYGARGHPSSYPDNSLRKGPPPPVRGALRSGVLERALRESSPLEVPGSMPRFGSDGAPSRFPRPRRDKPSSWSPPIRMEAAMVRVDCSFRSISFSWPGARSALWRRSVTSCSRAVQSESGTGALASRSQGGGETLAKSVLEFLDGRINSLASCVPELGARCRGALRTDDRREQRLHRTGAARARHLVQARLEQTRGRPGAPRGVAFLAGRRRAGEDRCNELRALDEAGDPVHRADGCPAGGGMGDVGPVRCGGRGVGQARGGDEDREVSPGAAVAAGAGGPGQSSEGGTDSVARPADGARSQGEAGHIEGMQHLNARISKAGGARFWFQALRNRLIAVADHDLMPPTSLTKRLINHAPGRNRGPCGRLDEGAASQRRPARRRPQQRIE